MRIPRSSEPFLKPLGRLVLLFGCLLFAFGCSNSGLGSSGADQSWMADSEYSTTKSSATYSGSRKDAVAWFDQKLSSSGFTAEFDCQVTKPGSDGTAEFIFLVYGNGKTSPSDFWSQGAVVNYKSTATSAEAYIRKNGIYSSTGSQYLHSATPAVYVGTSSHHYKITCQSGSISFSIDGTTIFQDSTLSLGSLDGYFGVANYSGNDDTFIISHFVLSQT